MSLDTQQFGISRNWLAVALDKLPANKDLFSRKKLGLARKAFLAGSNQLTAIKNWLSCAEIIEIDHGAADLTDIGRLMSAKDPSAKHAWTWWLFHLHLFVNVDAYPYNTFFNLYDSDDKSWHTIDDVVKALTSSLTKAGLAVSENSVGTYFMGIDLSMCPGEPFFELGLVERRMVEGETGRPRIRRCLLKPTDLITAYAALLFHKRYFPHEATVETRILLDRGLGRALGLHSTGLREALTRIQQNADLGRYVRYSRVANLDSVSFPALSLDQVRAHGYTSGEIRWP